MALATFTLVCCWGDDQSSYQGGKETHAYSKKDGERNSYFGMSSTCARRERRSRWRRPSLACRRSTSFMVPMETAESVMAVRYVRVLLACSGEWVCASICSNRFGGRRLYVQLLSSTANPYIHLNACAWCMVTVHARLDYMAHPCTMPYCCPWQELVVVRGAYKGDLGPLPSVNRGQALNIFLAMNEE